MSGSRAALGGSIALDRKPSLIAAEEHDTELRSAALARLTAINLNDLISSFGWQDRRLLRGAARALLRNPAQAFARQIVEFDTAVGNAGLVDASRHTLSHYVRDVRVFGQERVPQGSFLALANHPGLTDALSLFSALNRPDLRTIALDRPFLQALPHCAKHLSFLSEERPSSTTALREIGAHLRTGGAALTFPAGRIEPDPNVYGGAVESLQSWAQSAGLFIRLAPDTPVLPVLVRGVVWPKAAHNWFIRLRRTARDREKTAAALQLIAHVVLKVRPVNVTVQIGRPIYARDHGTTDTAAIHRAVLAEMSELIRNSRDDS